MRGGVWRDIVWRHAIRGNEGFMLPASLMMGLGTDLLREGLGIGDWQKGTSIATTIEWRIDNFVPSLGDKRTGSTQYARTRESSYEMGAVDTRVQLYVTIRGLDIASRQILGGRGANTTRLPNVSRRRCERLYWDNISFTFRSVKHELLWCSLTTTFYAVTITWCGTAVWKGDIKVRVVTTKRHKLMGDSQRWYLCLRAIVFLKASLGRPSLLARSPRIDNWVGGWGAAVEVVYAEIRVGVGVFKSALGGGWPYFPGGLAVTVYIAGELAPWGGLRGSVLVGVLYTEGGGCGVGLLDGEKAHGGRAEGGGGGEVPRWGKVLVTGVEKGSSSTYFGGRMVRPIAGVGWRVVGKGMVLGGWALGGDDAWRDREWSGGSERSGSSLDGDRAEHEDGRVGVVLGSTFQRVTNSSVSCDVGVSISSCGEDQWVAGDVGMRVCGHELGGAAAVAGFSALSRSMSVRGKASPFWGYDVARGLGWRVNFGRVPWGGTAQLAVSCRSGRREERWEACSRATECPSVEWYRGRRMWDWCEQWCGCEVWLSSPFRVVARAANTAVTPLSIMA
ncbi:hypothetical protein Tco_0654780 [Tanacetum coccineum]|uniref:Uncharacterized protein n=1 Tax=Tanacetum coccineum TaxID=301880 RepID=A0ABQ4X457_9ASTR